MNLIFCIVIDGKQFFNRLAKSVDAVKKVYFKLTGNRRQVTENFSKIKRRERTAILISILIVLGQIADLYLRYLPLKISVSEIELKNLQTRLLIWGICAVAIYEVIFNFCGISAASFKAVLMIGWIPFFIIAAVTMPRSFVQYLFIFGMSALWVMLQHNWISMLDVTFFLDAPQENLFLFHSAAYVAISIIFLPLVRKFFDVTGGGISWSFNSLFRGTPAGLVHCATSNFHWRRAFHLVGGRRINSLMGGKIFQDLSFVRLSVHISPRLDSCRKFF